MSKFTKLLLLGLAVVLVGLPAAAEDNKDFQLNGMLRTRFDHFEDYDANSNADDNYNFWAYRAMVGLTGNFTDNVAAHVDFQAIGDFGDSGTITPGTIYSSPFGNSGIGGGSSVDMYQAYVMLNQIGGTRWDLSVGRRELTFGRELQFGDNDFYNGQTFDGVLAHGNFESWNLGLGFLQLGEGQPAGNPADDDEWLAGGKVYFTLGKWGSLEPYLIHRRNGSNTARVDLSTIGALWMHSGEDSRWDASAEFAMQTGDSGPTAVDFGGSVFEAEFGWHLGDAHRIHINGLMASGDDGSDPTDNEDYQPLFPDLHAYNRLGNTDAFNLTNIQDLSFGYTGNFGENDTHKIMVAAHMLTAVEDTGTNPFVGGVGPLAGEDDLGTEIDATYEFKYSDNVLLDAGVATLSAGDALGASADDPFRFWGGLKVSWGPQGEDMSKHE